MESEIFIIESIVYYCILKLDAASVPEIFFYLKALFCQSTPSWLKVMWLVGGGGGWPGHCTVISWDSHPNPSPSPSHLTLDNIEHFFHGTVHPMAIEI